MRGQSILVAFAISLWPALIGCAPQQAISTRLVGEYPHPFVEDYSAGEILWESPQAFLADHPKASNTQWPREGRAPYLILQGGEDVAIFNAAGRPLYGQSWKTMMSGTIGHAVILPLGPDVVSFIHCYQSGTHRGETAFLLIGVKANKVDVLRLHVSSSGSAPADIRSVVWMSDVDGDGALDIGVEGHDCYWSTPGSGQRWSAPDRLLLARWDHRLGGWKDGQIRRPPLRTEVTCAAGKAENTLELTVRISNRGAVAVALHPWAPGRVTSTDAPGRSSHSIRLEEAQEAAPPITLRVPRWTVEPPQEQKNELIVPAGETVSLRFLLSHAPERRKTEKFSMTLTAGAKWGGHQSLLWESYAVGIGKDHVYVDADNAVWSRVLGRMLSWENEGKQKDTRTADVSHLPRMERYLSVEDRHWLVLTTYQVPYLVERRFVDGVMVRQQGGMAVALLQEGAGNKLEADVVRDLLLLALAPAEPSQYGQRLKVAGGPEAGLAPALCLVLADETAPVDRVALARLLVAWPDEALAQQAREVLKSAPEQD